MTALEVNLASMQEARDVDGRRVLALHSFGIFHFTIHRARDLGEKASLASSCIYVRLQ
jgi:hypothetical protein